MSLVNDFTTGNLVVVAGGTVDKAQSCTENVMLCRVQAVGEEDLLVKEETRHYPSFFKVSKKLCTPVHIEPSLFVSAQPLTPQLGDLVMTYPTSRYGDKSEDTKSGILYEITTARGVPSSCKILYNNTLEEVTYTSLIVLQRAQKNK